MSTRKSIKLFVLLKMQKNSFFKKDISNFNIGETFSLSLILKVFNTANQGNCAPNQSNFASHLRNFHTFYHGGIDELFSRSC